MGNPLDVVVVGVGLSGFIAARRLIAQGKQVHWAGTEVSPRWPGYFEGAIEAGELAASTVARHLSP